MSWWVYLVECRDASLYTGITTDVERRVAEHNSEKKGARYTRARQPVELKYQEAWPDRAQASQREYEIKKLTKQQKWQLMGGEDE